MRSSVALAAPLEAEAEEAAAGVEAVAAVPPAQPRRQEGHLQRQRLLRLHHRSI
jgi:hypothetical protein